MRRGRPKDYYSILGIGRNAELKEIKHAFRALAQQHHPDHNPGNPLAEERFKTVQEAYGVLSDRKKKLVYDRRLRLHEAMGHARTDRQSGRTYTQRPMRRQYGSWLSWLFSELEPRRNIVMKLPFEKAFRGGPVIINVPKGKPVRVVLPEGIQDGYTIRIKDISGPPLQITFKTLAHKAFRVQGDDLIRTKPLTVDVLSAIVGRTLQVDHPGGDPVPVVIPPGTQPGEIIRVPGKGLRGGDMVLKVRVRIPRNLTEAQRSTLRQAAEATGLL